MGHATFSGCGAWFGGFARDIAVSRQQALDNELPLFCRGKRFLAVDLFDVTVSPLWAPRTWQGLAGVQVEVAGPV